MSNANDSQLKTLKAELKRLATENDDISKSWTVEGSNVEVSTQSANAFKANVAKGKEISERISLLESQGDLNAFLDEPENADLALKAAAEVHNLETSPKLRRTIGELFVESDEFKSFRRMGGVNMPVPWEVKGVDLGSMWTGSAAGPGRKDLYTQSPTANPNVPFGFGPVEVDPNIVPLAQRTVRIRDLFPVQPTQAAVIEFFRVSGFVNNASVVPERDATASPVTYATKPHSNLNFLATVAPVRTIAHWETAHRNTLDDVNQLQGIVNNELLYGLRLTEDAQILNGSGNGEDLLGILNTPNIQGLARSGGDNYADVVRRAMTRAFLAYYEPTGVVVHPIDWEAIELLKATTGQYIVATNVAIGAVKQVWRLPVVDTPAISQGTALVGAFGIGATLYDRMLANVRISDSNGFTFVQNAITILAEERIALAVKRPESFVKVSF